MNGRGSLRVLRGGSWSGGGKDYFRGSYRLSNDPTDRYDRFGFRCAMSL